MRNAERFAFHLLDWPEEKLTEMGQVIETTRKNLQHCSECNCLIEQECPFCIDPERQKKILCVVASPKDVFAIEQTGQFLGLYHVLGGLFSPLQGMAPAPWALEKLKERISTLAIDELILALDSTLEGDTTALFIKKELEPLTITTTRLALGLPMGSSLDYIDGGTLGQALAGRHSI